MNAKKSTWQPRSRSRETLEADASGPNAHESGNNNTSQRSALALTLLASVILQLVRWHWVSRPWLVLLVDAGYTLLLVFGVSYVLSKRPRSARTPSVAIGVALAISCLPLIEQGILRGRFSIGEANEVTAAVCIRNLMLGLAVLGRHASLQRTACLLSVFITLAAVMMMMRQSVLVYFLLAIYAVVGMLWLMGSYWDRLKGKLADETHRKVPLRFAIGVPSIVLLGALVVTTTVGATTTTRMLWGFMSTSGGTGGEDPYARDGVGDGDAMVAATDDAMSFGPVDSQLFLESKMPSLYDVVNEKYGDPLKEIKNSEKAQALATEFFKETHQKIAKSKRSGRQFSTVRRSFSQRRNRKLADRDAPAMLYVVGRTPLHLRMEVFDTFDGRSWHSTVTVPKQRDFQKTKVGTKPWLMIDHNSLLPRWPAPERHAVKIINLRSNRIPSPDQLTGVHINQIEREDMFAWTPDGILKMDRELIPQLTVVHLTDHPIDRPSVRLSGLDSDSYLAAHRQVARTPRIDEVTQLAKQWTGDIPHGWVQVEAIVTKLRESYVFDNTTSVPADTDDALGHFLFTSKRGPDYLFASSAAIMLRSLGYPARVVSGFYASPDRYDPDGRQTIVLKEDVHFWAEVCVDGRTWISVEPTPGYELLSPPRSLAENVVAAFAAMVHWIGGHKFVSAIAIATVITIFVFRRKLIDIVLVFLWRIVCLIGSQRQVQWTIWLLERRAWLSGCPRPPTQTLNAWYGRLQTENQNANEDSTLHRLLSLANQVLYAPQSSHDADAAQNICRSAVAHWTLRRIREQRKLMPT